MTKYYRLVEISPEAVECYTDNKDTFVLLTDNPRETHAPDKIDYARHIQEGSALVCNLDNLIKGIELAV